MWSPNLAYAIGLLTSDGYLSVDGRHIDLTSKDKQQLKNFKYCLGLKVKIGYKSSGSTDKRYMRVQFSDVAFYQFLLTVGLTPNKSKTLGALNIPRRFFFDFLRGLFDGDGSFYSYWDPRWKSSFMFYISFVSASPAFIQWLRTLLRKFAQVEGHVSKTKGRSYEQLRFAKRESLKIIEKMYYGPTVVCLRRKKEKILKALKNRQLDKLRAGGEISKRTTLRW